MATPQPQVGLIWISTVDPTVGSGVVAPLWQFCFRSDDSSLYIKTGPAATSWTLISGGGGGGDNLQAFEYVADGSEDPDDIAISVPVPVGSTAYSITDGVMTGDPNYNYTLVVLTKASGGFHVAAGAQPLAGHRFMFIVKPFT